VGVRSTRILPLVLTAAVLLGIRTSAVAAPRATDASSGLRRAQVATQRAFKGTSTNVDPTPRHAVKGKRVVVISAGQSSISASVPTDAAVNALHAIGWHAEVYDANLTPANYAPLVRQAIASGADGILLITIDCRAVQQPLREARAKGIAVIGVGAFDCDDPHGGGARRGLFSAQISFGPRGADLGALVSRYGVDQANYIVAKSKNRAKVIDIQDPEFTTLYYTDRGFRNAIARSGGSQIVGTVQLTSADFVTNKVVPKIQAEMLRHPEANWIRSPYTYTTTLGVVPALGGKQTIDVMGGEGFEPELDLIRTGRITAVNIFSSEWAAWAGVDTMNSVFLKEAPVDSGLGWVMADADHNVPASGPYRPAIDYQAEYRKAWGVS